VDPVDGVDLVDIALKRHLSLLTSHFSRLTFQGELG
jgi:hypothetical protein